MSHDNAPLTPEGRLRLIRRIQNGRPLAHVAAEAGVSRACLSKWHQRYQHQGEDGLHDRSSRPQASPDTTPDWVVELIETWRREHKWAASRIAVELEHEHGFGIHPRTVGRWFKHLSINRRRHLDPGGESNRQPGTITATAPGAMVHLDVKKAGRIPEGGGWFAHGRDSEAARAASRSKSAAKKQGHKIGGYTYLYSAVDGYTRLAYTEVMQDEKAATAVEFLNKARAFFAAEGITRLGRVVTDNGVNFAAGDFTQAVNNLGGIHQRIRPYTPRHNGKVERYQRILAEECLYARTYDSESARGEAMKVWVQHYNHHRPHSAADGQAPASLVPGRVTNVLPSYT